MAKVRQIGILLGSLLAGFCISAKNYRQEGSILVRAAATPGSIAGIEAMARHITPADRARFFDCREYSQATMPWRSETAEFDIFNNQLNDKRKFYLAEESGWPFVVGYHNLERHGSDLTWLVVMRGESSGFHSSAATRAMLRLADSLPGTAMISIDEYMYREKNRGGVTPLHPICHRTYYPARLIGTESPGFDHGGAMRLLKRVLPSRDPVVFVSYSNSTTPRGEFIARKLVGGAKPDFRNFSDPRRFLSEYILKSVANEQVYENIRGFIDIEGNYEYKKAFWDLLAFIKIEIDPDPAKFYYSAVRIEKFDAYPVQTTMIRALGLTGIEDNNGVIRFTNARGNVMIDVITNPYQPYYSGSAGDIRLLTQMQATRGKNVRREPVTHFGIGDWATKRLLATTVFLRKGGEGPVTGPIALE